MMYQRPCSPVIVLVFLLSAFCLVPIVTGQSATATLSGTVEDQNGAVIPGAAVTAVNTATTLERQATTDSNGSYAFPLLPPGTYIVRVQAQGFTPVENRNIVLNVGDRKALQIQLKAGDINATVQVINDAPLINESPAVGTVVDQKYVANMPLNGRSFQSLILLTPGVVTISPQASSATGQNGELSVNGQRTESNYYTVDGVSANVGIEPSNATRPGTSGSLPAATALGTTQGLVSVDALEEFRVQSSSYSAEYGRNPGGQFSFVTRSGTNEWHGTAFEYLRNNVFDANDWFNNSFGLKKPFLRQNDFGGTLGGPVLLPRFGEGAKRLGYNGRNRTFFFFSYEGLRLVRPQAATVQYVPDANLRASTPAPLQQAMNAFPLSNCTGPAPPPNCPPPLDGLAGFIATWSNPGHINSTSIRLDHAVNERLKLFFRFSDTTSSSAVRFLSDASVVQPTTFAPRSYTAVATSLFSHLSNDFRLNYSSNQATNSNQLDNFGGAVPVNLLQLHGFSAASTVNVALFLPGANGPTVSQSFFQAKQQQWNLVDNVSLSVGNHQLKFGVDYRRLTPFQISPSPNLTYFFFSKAQVLTNSPAFAQAVSRSPAYPLYTNFAAFFDDQWRISPRLNVSLGLRWEVNPAPGSTRGNSNLPFTAQGNSLSALTLASQGTPLWRTGWFNFAPRFGLAYVVRNAPGRETILRTGGGVFFDTGQQLGSTGYAGIGFSAVVNIFAGAHFPLSPAQASPVIVNPPVAPYTAAPVAAFAPHLQLPFTLQWNVSIEQALGKSQAITLSYVGSNGRRLLEVNQVTATPLNASFGTVQFIRNALTSNYQAFQFQFQRRLSHGLTALGSYTWSHSIDFGSLNTGFRAVRGNSDFDVRQNLSAAFSYDLPSHFHGSFARAMLNHWGLDDRFTARSGFPVTLLGPRFTDPATGTQNNAGLNLVPGIPLYVYNPNYPGGRAINGSAFSPPAGCSATSCAAPPAAIGNAPRNVARGFGEWQMDLAIRRDFPIHERMKLQFRAEAFNVFNHPNFGLINTTFGNAQFGQATRTLAQSLGTLDSLYQSGGTRSMQFALKLVF